jgi:hypothetical protein
MKSLILGLNLREFPFEDSYALVPFIDCLPEIIDNPQVLMIDIVSMPILA